MLISLGTLIFFLLGRPVWLVSTSAGRRVLAIGAAATAVGVLGMSVEAREWTWTRLGYGYAPAGMWMAALGTALLNRQWLAKKYWSYWVAGALMVMGILGFLSLLHPAYGLLEETGLSGHWGRIFGGEPLALGIPKSALFFWLIPFVVAPSWAIMAHKRGAAAMSRTGVAIYQTAGAGVGVLVGRVLGSQLATEVIPEAPPQDETKKKVGGLLGKWKKGEKGKEEAQKEHVEKEGGQSRLPARRTGWKLPKTDMLAIGEAQPMSRAALNEMSQTIETTLADHGVEVSVQDVKVGPRVIQFGLVPGWNKKTKEVRGTRMSEPVTQVDMSRVKVHSILAREQDLALALKTSDLRLQAPVPGEALVGIEVPNPNPNRVYLRAVAESTSFRKIAAKGGLPLALGQGTGGEPVAEDLAELPHLLIAGATGSGKSVCINTIITSLIMAKGPDRLRMIMVDPKRVELTPFNGLPHLVVPVIVDSDRVMPILGAIMREMFRRYRVFEEAGVRNLAGYNRKAKDPMPFLLLIVDELADLMMTSGYEVEQALVRLAQLGRATGIHLILCTQRPSVNVVTGLLKANIAARIAFAVASQVDSRVILDEAGADRLLGKGDMLFISAQSPKPRRVQGTWVTDEEIEAVVKFWKEQEGPSLSEIKMEEPESEEGQAGGDLTDDEALLDKAQELLEKYKHVSPGLLQRRLQIGYQKALQLVETLETEGFVAAGEPGKSRGIVKREGDGMVG
jgi:S-DNA-T family DNA segregation ATPase FtsK/SpoIIIE